MEISASEGIITIKGNIKSIHDFQDIKNLVDGVVAHHKAITIHIVDSISLTSSVIGYLNKLVLKDGINIVLKIGNPDLLDLISDLNLTATFNAKRL